MGNLVEKTELPHIYLISNLINGKIYIGQTNGRDKWYFAGGVYINKAIKKYGKENFKREILISGNFSRLELDSWEIFYIELFCARDRKIGYNSLEGGLRGRGLRHSLESRQKIKKARAKQTFSEETRKKIGEYHKGNKHRLGHIQSEETKSKKLTSRKKTAEENGYWFTQETNKKRRDKLVGYKHSDEMKKNLSRAHKGKKQTDSQKEKLSEIMLKRYYKPFECFDKEGNLVASFDNIITAYKFFGIEKNSCITNVLKERQRTYLGCIFKYKEV